MRKNTQDFATSLLDHARTSNELEIMLNFNPTGENWEPGERQTLERLKLAIKYKQKQACSMLLSPLVFYKSSLVTVCCSS
jgi:transient receptor potential cation channel subfamily C member 4